MSDEPALYDLPLYYDVAFSWDAGPEVELIERAIDDHAVAPVRRLLEPACGSGRMLIPLAMCGYMLAGYDNAPTMVAFARERIAACGLADRVRVEQADMTTARFNEHFDAAYNLITSISHLTDHADLIAHLRSTAAALKPGGIYIVQFGGVYNPSGYETEQWTCERDGVRVDSEWWITDDFPDRGISRLRCRMTIDDHGRRIEHDEPFDVRLWTDATWRQVVADAGGWTHLGGYDEWLDPIEPDDQLTPDHGNAYVVLRRD